ncbi:MAG TPA: hypothetical protein VFK23_04110 [Nitrospirota bacterium]|nr:hypothetical protein [Nitrospirota bacterium]
MKTSTVGLVLAVILMVVAGIGFGIAQAGGNHKDGPELSFEDQEALGQGSSSSPYADDRPVLSFGDEMQLRNPTETGSLPDTSNTDSSVKYEIIDGVTWYRVEGKLYELYGP